MAYAAANGAVGKSPLIDQMNQLPGEQLTDRTAAQMEKLVFSSKSAAGAPASFPFDSCREEIKRQMQR